VFIADRAALERKIGMWMGMGRLLLWDPVQEEGRKRGSCTVWWLSSKINLKRQKESELKTERSSFKS
jgi:hypothetical protein